MHKNVEPSITSVRRSSWSRPSKWRPLIMSFCHFFGRGPQIHPSRLAEIPEAAYTPAHLREARAARDAEATTLA